jgi:hypothetical protein
MLLYKFSKIKYQLVILIFWMPLINACRTQFKKQSQAKPLISGLKLVVENTGDIHCISGEPHKFVIQNGNYMAVDGNLIDLDKNICYPIKISEELRRNFRGVYSIDEYNKINQINQFKVEVIGLKSVYNIYKFGDGWSPFITRTRSIASFTGEFHLIIYGIDKSEIIVSQKVKNYPYEGIDIEGLLEDTFSSRFGLSHDLKYMYYLDKEPGGKRLIYFLSL